MTTSKFISKLFSLEGKVALVTGASSGLGADFARALAAAGADVVVTARRVDRLDALAADIEQAGGKAHAVSVDVTEAASVSKVFDEASSKFGVPNIIVNNAGTGRWKPFLELTDEDWDETLDPNVSGVRRVTLEAARRLIAAKQGGSVITIGSILSFRVRRRQAAYATSKAAAVQLTRAMAADLWEFGIRVNALCPGFFRTDMTEPFLDSEYGQNYQKIIPPKRLGQIDELLGPLLLLASDASSYMTGSVIVVDGGHSSQQI
jgi:NAD(P)-dependent dehydrogenase (short-subunit alcohol dehydrogenase family)